MRRLAVVVAGGALFLSLSECRAQDQAPRWFWGGDLMVRNADLLSISGLGAIRLVGTTPRPTLAVAARLRAGIGGGNGGVGLLLFYDCPHVGVPCLALGAQAVVLRTWPTSDWNQDTYFGGELRLELVFINVTLGLLGPASGGPSRLQAGVGVGF